MAKNVYCGVQLFPDDTIFNRRCDDMPVHSLSSTWLTALEASSGIVHINWNSSAGSLPTLTNPNSDINAPITVVTYPQFCNISGAFLPIDIPIDTSGDARVIAIDTINNRLTEITAASIVSNVWNCGSGATWNLSEYNTPPAPTNTWALAANAAGLPTLPLFPRWEEIYINNLICHALNMVVPATYQTALWPATAPGNTSTTTNPPMGARVRLSSSFNIDTFDSRPEVRTLLRCLQQYGCIVRDNGAANGFTIEATSDSRWLATPFYAGTLSLPALTNFEFVDESKYMKNHLSYQAIQGDLS